MCSKISILILMLSILSIANATSYKYDQSMELESIDSFSLTDENQKQDTRKTNSIVSRVINGESASLTTVRHMANLIIVGKKGGPRDLVSSCTGTVIGRRWLLTAAHCYFLFGGVRASIEDSYAFVGEANATLRSGNTSIRPYKFRKFLIHREFNWRRNADGNDIALVQLDRPIEASKFSKVKLLSRKFEKLKPGTVVRAAGYGLTDIPSAGNLDTLAKRLNVASLIMGSFETCKSRERAQIRSSLSEKKLLCAVPGKSRNGPTNICFGDSGGPLFLQEPGQPILQIAVTSFSTTLDCRAASSISWFTRVSYHRKEIRQGMRGNTASWNVISAA